MTSTTSNISGVVVASLSKYPTALPPVLRGSVPPKESKHCLTKSLGPQNIPKSTKSYTYSVRSLAKYHKLQNFMTEDEHITSHEIQLDSVRCIREEKHISLKNGDQLFYHKGKPENHSTRVWRIGTELADKRKSFESFNEQWFCASNKLHSQYKNDKVIECKDKMAKKLKFHIWQYTSKLSVTLVHEGT